MYGKNKIIGPPSDAQSKEKLAMYVHEYLVHIGAQKTASSFLQEIRWDKSITVGDSPGFLHSWWSVFWDLYSAAPERRDTYEHTNEAKAFHDYGFVTSGYPNGLPHEHCMPTRPLSNASFLHRVSQSGGHPGLQGPIGGGPGSGPPGTNMPPSLGPLCPESGNMRQRLSLPPSMLSGGGPGSGPNLGPSPQPMHPSMRFHQPGGPYGPAGMMPQHPGSLPGQQAGHPGPLPHHMHPSGHPPSRVRWIGPPGSGPQGPGGGGHPPQTSSGGGIIPSPGHPGTPGTGPPQVSAQSPNNNGNNSEGPHHPTPPHYAQQQQTPPASSCIGQQPDQQIFSSRSGGPLVVGPPLDNQFCGGPPDGMMNGGGGGNSGRNAMMPPPPPEYGLPVGTSATGSYAGDMKMSPCHPGDMLSGGGGGGPNGPGLLLPGPGDYVGGFGGPQMPPEGSGGLLMSSQMQPGNGGGPPGGSMLHGGGPGGSQQGGGAPPPPQYMSSHQQLNQQSGSHGVPCGGPVQFPQEYSFNPITQ